MELLEKAEDKIYALKKELRQLKTEKSLQRQSALTQKNRAYDEARYDQSANVQNVVGNCDAELPYKIEDIEERIETRQQIIKAIIKSFENMNHYVAQQEAKQA